MDRVTIQQLIETLEPRLQEEVREVLERARQILDDEEILRLLEEGRYQDVVDAATPPPALGAQLGQQVQAAFTQAGQVSADLFSGRIVFDPGHPEAAAWSRQASARLVTMVTDEQRESVRSVVSEGVAQGESPRQTALTISGRYDRSVGQRRGGIVGLSRPQAETVARVRRGLRDGDVSVVRDYLKMSLRDRRFDSTVRKIADGQQLTEEGLEKIVSRLTDRSLKLRADTIARTEMITALSAARHHAFQQMLEQSNYSDGEVEREWVDSSDARVRHSHRQMSGQVVVGMNTPFVSPDSGALMRFPGDTALGAPARERINCRCFVLYRIKI